MSRRRPRRSSPRQPGRPAAEARPQARESLLDAASRLFGQYGVSAVSLRRLASEADVTPAMVHYYFGSKEGLYHAMLERTFARILERVRAALAQGRSDAEPTGDQLEALLAVLMEALAAEPWVPTLVVREVFTEGGRFRERFIRGYASQMAELLPGLVRREVEARRFREDLDPQLAYLSLMGMTLLPFVARPVAERVLGIAYDAEFLRRFAAHTQRLFVQGARA